MSRSIFIKEGKAEILARIQNLHPTTPALWGKMNATEMMHHCVLALQLIINAEPKNKKSTFQQQLLRVYFLYIRKKFPKEVMAPKTINIQKLKVQALNFEQEKTHLFKQIDLLCQHQQIHARHPYFGKLSYKEWGIFNWMHLDHHLRQFGV